MRFLKQNKTTSIVSYQQLVGNLIKEKKSDTHTRLLKPKQEM